MSRLILILQESDKICKEVAITGEGVDTSKAKITLDKVCVQWNR